jgi:2'-5' RNA ligase
MIGDTPTSSPPARLRLFFAFWPEDRVRHALEAARARLFPLAGRPVATGDLHVTAAFIGLMESARVDALKALTGTIPAFDLVFDQLEHWPKPRVLVATCRHVTPAAHKAVDDLWRRLDRQGFARDPRPYKPHVTLARDVRTLRTGLAWQAVPWTVTRLRLVESLPSTGASGLRYRPID